MTGVPPPGPDEPQDRQGGDARAYRRPGDPQDHVGRFCRLCPTALCEVKARPVRKQVKPGPLEPVIAAVLETLGQLVCGHVVAPHVHSFTQ